MGRGGEGISLDWMSASPRLSFLLLYIEFNIDIFGSASRRVVVPSIVWRRARQVALAAGPAAMGFLVRLDCSVSSLRLELFHFHTPDTKSFFLLLFGCFCWFPSVSCYVYIYIYIYLEYLGYLEYLEYLRWMDSLVYPISCFWWFDDRGLLMLDRWMRKQVSQTRRVIFICNARNETFQLERKKESEWWTWEVWRLIMTSSVALSLSVCLSVSVSVSRCLC